MPLTYIMKRSTYVFLIIIYGFWFYLKFFDHFELAFVCDVRKGSEFIFLIVINSLSHFLESFLWNML